MSATAEQTSLHTAQQTTELDRLFNREEVLQICYWYQGEGFGEVYSPPVLNTFLNCELDAIENALFELHQQGYLEPITGIASTYQFTDSGKKEGGRLFADSFAELQKAQHGECAAGCCDGDDHSQCGDACSLH